jgi:lipopolysaccharide assembly outer membrane protein LptD (OstA)
MKLFAFSFLIVSQVCVFVAQAAAQGNAIQPERLHITRALPQGSLGPVGRVEFTASSIERDLSSRETEAIIRLRGNVEVRMITCGVTGPGDKVECDRGSMILHADAVDYNAKTGEIQPRGDVRITPYRPAP